MKITIQGQDYSAALDAAHPLTIEYAECAIGVQAVAESASGRRAGGASRYQPAVAGDGGQVYFTGYSRRLRCPSTRNFADGPSYRYARKRRATRSCWIWR